MGIVWGGSQFDDLMIGLPDDDMIYGNEGNDTIKGMGGNDSLFGGPGSDSIEGNEGNDTLYGEADFDNYAPAGNDSLFGGGGNDVIYGGDGNDSLDGGEGNDSLIGGNGVDKMYFTGTFGNDSVTGGEEIYINGTRLQGQATYNSSTGDWSLGGYRISADHTIFSGSDSIHLMDWNAKTNNYGITLGSMLDPTINGTSGNDSLTGSTGNDTINGGEGNDTLVGAEGNDYLDGGAGKDVLIGGTGDDTYVIDSPLDLISEKNNEGTDTVISSFSYSLAGSLENLTLSGTEAISGTGNTLNNVLTGNSADNLLNGGYGNDTMIGGKGNDTYVVDMSGDAVVEKQSEGIDTVLSSITYTLTENVEHLTLTGSTAINGTGNDLNNMLTGNAADNVLNGGAGNDTLSGGLGNDTLISGSGSDTLSGGDGYDKFVISGDATSVRITDFAMNEKLDLTQFTTVHSLSDLNFTSFPNFFNYHGEPAVFGIPDGHGGFVEVTVDGLAGLGILFGGKIIFAPETPTATHTGTAGNDALIGTAGNDAMYGNSGNDTLNGGAGADHIFGGDGADRIIGGDGDDSLYGGDGNDVLIAGHGNDYIDGGEGIDTLSYETESSGVYTELVGQTYIAANNEFDYFFNVENVSGSNFNDTLKGDDTANVLVGNGGNDWIEGNGGSDILKGGAGHDLFVFNELAYSSTAAPDRIMDFTVGEDKIYFNSFSGLPGTGFTGIELGAASGSTLGYTYDVASDKTIVTSSADFKLILDGHIQLTSDSFIFSYHASL